MFAARSYKNYGVSTDPYFNNTSLLLHGDGTNGAQNNTFLDSSSNNFIITRNGTATQGSFSPFPLNGATYDLLVNGGSGYFDGSGDYLTIPDNPAFNLGSSNFTAECWVYFNSSVNQYFFGQIQSSTANRSFCLALISSRLYFEVRSGSTAYIVQDSNNAVLNSWIHIAAVRNGNTITLYKNGISVGTVSVTGITVNDSTNLIGVGCGGGYVAAPMNGYISNARLVVGTAVYTSNFTPPITPVTSIVGTSLLCNFTNAGIFDNTEKNNLITVGNAQISTSVKKYGTGSIAFDGVGDELTIPQNAVFQFGTGDFTIECWVYCTNLAGGTGQEMQLIDFRSSQVSEVRPTVAISGGAFIYFTAGATRISSGSISANTWYHFAVSRVSGITRMFVNGIKVGVDYVDSNSYLISAPIIGSAGSWISGYDFVGYMDDIRITKDVGRYAANFTPPQQAFPDQ